MFVSEDKPIGHLNSLKERKIIGAHYTPTELSFFLAESIVSSYKDLPDKINILDPAIGDGELLISLLKKLKGNKDISIFGFDTDKEAVKFAQKKIKDRFNVNINFLHEDFLDYVMARMSNDLFSPELPQFDIIIANPPYVRTQLLGSQKSQLLASKFGLSGRIDLYYVFLQALTLTIKDNGRLGVITPNRILSTRSSSQIRRQIFKNFEILHIWDLGDTKLFDAAILPAVLLLKKKGNPCLQEESKFTRVYTTKQDGKAFNSADSVFDVIKGNGVFQIRDKKYLIEQGKLDLNNLYVWTLNNSKADEFSQAVIKNTKCYFGDIAKIRVGVKTTNDKVFIRSDWNLLFPNTEPELLRPIYTHNEAHPFKSHNKLKTKILYTHEVKDGERKTVDIEKYPISHEYLLNHKDELAGREYIKKAKRQWFEIWVPQNPNIWSKKKIIFRDISEKPVFWLDLSGAVVNGDCYWVELKPDISEDYLWLMLAIGNSSFIEKYYDRFFNNKLYSGKRRFITQYVEKFPLPDIDKPEAARIIELSKYIYDHTDLINNSNIMLDLNKRVFASFEIS